ESIRLKIQPRQHGAPPTPERQPKVMPRHAVSALAELGASLEDGPRNEGLKAAIARLVERQRG
ncbi:MAG: hypothetical protein ACO1N5_00790, partial [Noviherbaspirillum sp.]